MEKAREDFTDLLINYKKAKSHDITVVFDGHKSGSGSENVAVRGGVKIIFSRLRERADDVIKRITTNDRLEWIVVSSDRDIARHAWSVGSIPVPAERFLEIISMQVRNGGLSEEPESAGEKNDYDDGSGDFRPKGNPRQLSKKEKAVRKALGKL